MDWILANPWILLIVPIVVSQWKTWFPKLAALLPKKPDGTPDDSLLIDLLNVILKSKGLPLIKENITEAPTEVLATLKVQIDEAIVNKTKSLKEKLESLLPK